MLPGWASILVTCGACESHRFGSAFAALALRNRLPVPRPDAVPTRRLLPSLTPKGPQFQCSSRSVHSRRKMMPSRCMRGTLQQRCEHDLAIDPSASDIDSADTNDFAVHPDVRSRFRSVRSLFSSASRLMMTMNIVTPNGASASIKRSRAPVAT